MQWELNDFREKLFQLYQQAWEAIKRDDIETAANLVRQVIAERRMPFTTIDVSKRQRSIRKDAGKLTGKEPIILKRVIDYYTEQKSYTWVTYVAAELVWVLFKTGKVTQATELLDRMEILVNSLTSRDIPHQSIQERSEISKLKMKLYDLRKDLEEDDLV